jgi:hypothetical protein
MEEDPQGERQMKIALTIGVAVVMPFGLVILAGVLASRMLAKYRHLHGSAYGGGKYAFILGLHP